MIREDEIFDSLISIVRISYLLEATTPIVLTYEFLEWMLVPDGNQTPPIDILSNANVELFMSVRVIYLELSIYVTLG